jgi:Flp pilus assembly protein TadD
MVFRQVPAVEVSFRLGDELLRIHRLSAADPYLKHAEKISPNNPLTFEGLGIAAAYRGEHQEAVNLLRKSLDLGSKTFISHYAYADQLFRLSSRTGDHYVPVKDTVANEIRTELEKSLVLMPDFAAAHHLLGLFQMVQGEDAASAEKHLQRAVQLEPENLSYLFSLAQAQLAKDDTSAARRSLALLARPYVDAKIRSHAEKLLMEIEGGKPKVQTPIPKQVTK